MTEATRQFRDGVRALVHDHDATRLASAAARLIGLGEGLTPSGDDVLAGFAFLAAQPGMRLGAAVPAIRSLVRSSSARTTLVSLAMLLAATEAEGRQSMHDLCHAVRSGRPGAIADAADRVRSIGHSSGSAILGGMGVALELEAEARLRDRRASSRATERGVDEHEDPE